MNKRSIYRFSVRANYNMTLHILDIILDLSWCQLCSLDWPLIPNMTLISVVQPLKCNNTFIQFPLSLCFVVPQVSKSYYTAKDIDVKITEINDGIYRIAGFVDTYGLHFNQFLIDDEKPVLIHTGPIGMYKKIEERVKEIIPLQKLAYVAFLHFESDEWGGMAFLDSADAKLVCSL